MQAAVLGYGRWGRVVAGKLAAMPEADLVAVVDPDMGARAVAHDQLGVAVYDTLESMYEEQQPHMACITTPPQLHALHALECMSHDSHVWVTKPMAMTVGDCEAIIAASGTTFSALPAVATVGVTVVPSSGRAIATMRCT